ncbi:hypothetical protein TNCV_860171 [Trichonephila clavipes]|nr:hypothetical protein TNCV_860171 [Trichonephila clavipes]
MLTPDGRPNRPQAFWCLRYPNGYGRELTVSASRVRVLESEKIRRLEGLIHVKPVEAQSTHVGLLRLEVKRRRDTLATEIAGLLSSDSAPNNTNIVRKDLLNEDGLPALGMILDFWDINFNLLKSGDLLLDCIDLHENGRFQNHFHRISSFDELVICSLCNDRQLRR